MLINTDEGTDILQQSEKAAGTSEGGDLVVPPGWQYAIPIELIEDPLVFDAALREF